MKKLVLKTALALLFSSGLQSFNAIKAQDVTYIMSDKLCINKLDYHIVEGKGVDFYDFHVTLSTSEKLIMRVPKMDNMHIAKFKTLEPNAQYIKCSELEKLNTAFINKINENPHQPLYIVEPNAIEQGFIAYQVNEIIVVKDTEASLSYKDKRYDFVVDKRAQYDKNTNLNKTNLSVNLLQKGKNNCLETYTFSASVNNATEAPVQIEFISGLGINTVKTAQGQVALKTVNGALAAHQITTICNVQEGIKTPLSNKPASAKPNESIAQQNPSSTPTTTTKSRSLFEKPAPAPTTPIPTPPAAVESNANGVNPTTSTTSIANTPPAGTTSRGLKPKTTSLPMPKEVPPGFHLVKEGDNLYKIAQEYAITVNHIKYWNNLPSDAIQVNQLLKVVDDGYNNYKGQNPIYREINARRFVIHKVEQHETLGAISKKYRTSIQNLYQWNKLENDALQIGQELIVGEESL